VCTLLTLPALLYWQREPVLRWAGRILVVEDAAPADYLVVPGGGAETRPFTASALYRTGLATKVIIFTQRPDAATELGVAPLHGDLYRRILEVEGVRPGAIVQLPDIVRSSWDEAQSARRFLQRNPAARIVIVTSPEHTRRSRWLYRKVLAGMGVDVRTAAARETAFNETNWWRDERGFLVFLHEYIKLPYYWVSYSFRTP
jgi:uncharacterized SAM-binding protein YcdF (DUF218 family)